MTGIRLKRATEPAWVSVGRGAKLLAAPPTTMLVYIARAEATRLLAEAASAGEAFSKAGFHVEGRPDFTDPQLARAVYDGLFVLALVEQAVSDWDGVLAEDGAPLPFDPALLGVLLQDHAVADKFLGNYLHPLNAVSAEGNG